MKYLKKYESYIPMPPVPESWKEARREIDKFFKDYEKDGRIIFIEPVEVKVAAQVAKYPFGWFKFKGVVKLKEMIKSKVNFEYRFIGDTCKEKNRSIKMEISEYEKLLDKLKEIISRILGSRKI